MNDIELLHVLRGAQIESVHRGSVAIFGQSGKLIHALGEPIQPVWLRSIAKPFQAGYVVESGAAERFGITQPELAVMCGSHGGTAEQVDLLRGVLERIGASVADLRCGVSAPLDRKAAEALALNGEQPTALNHPCSGKHTGMLAICKAVGWETDGYEHADHPLQTAIREYLAQAAGATRIAVALDGCSVPTFGLSLYAVALAFARLSAIPRIPDAMRTYPVLMSGHRRMDTTLMQLTGGRIIAKDGSEGLFALCIPEAGIGLAIKISDGSTRALMPVLAELLARFGHLGPDEREHLHAAYPTAIPIHTGEIAGELKVVI